MIHCSFHTATRGYDHFNRLTGVNGYGYTYNARDQRTKQTLIDGQSWEYSYDELGQVISGVKKTAAGAAVSGQNYAYAYDTVGNRETATANAVETNYTANQLNQYTAIGSIIPTYDVNGNQLTGYNGWTMEWNGENRLKAIYNATARLEFAYDYNGRRFSKKTYAKSGADWVLSSEKKFIYDGFKQIAEYNGTTLAQAYVWQPAGSGDFDVPLWMKADSNVYTYVTDGNKNVRQLKTAAGAVVATYDYDPFGNVAATGGVGNNPWQFSSEFRDTETGLIYYNYRYYAPSIGRWISRDPIWEEGGVNLYIMIANSLISSYDSWGYGFWSRVFNVVGGALQIAAGGVLIGTGGPAGWVLGGLIFLQGVANLVAGFRADESNMGILLSQRVAEAVGLDPQTGALVYVGIEAVTGLVNIASGGKTCLQIIFKGEKYVRQSVNYVRQYPFFGQVATRIVPLFHYSEYVRIHWSIRVLLGGQTVFDAYTEYESVRDFFRRIEPDKKEDLELRDVFYQNIEYQE